MNTNIKAQFERVFAGEKGKTIAVIVILEILFAMIVLRGGGTGDAGTGSLRWIGEVLNNGLAEAYRLNSGDYPPLSRVIVLGVVKIAALLSADVFIVFKWSLLVALVLTTLCFWARTLDGPLTGLLATSLYLNGVALVYIDTYYAPTLILSLWALQRKRTALFSFLFAVSCLIKWQPLIIGPLLLVHALSIPIGNTASDDSYVKRWLYLVVPALAAFAPVLAIFGLSPINASIHTALTHSYLSGNALNFNWLLTYYLGLQYPDVYKSITDGTVHFINVNVYLRWVNAIKLVFFLAYFGALWRVFKVRSSFVASMECVLAGYLCYFVLNIGVHENHLFIATVLAAITAFFSPAKRLRAVVIIALSNLNLITFYGLVGTRFSFSRIVGIDVTILFAALNVVLFAYFWTALVVRGKVDGSSGVLGAQPTRASR